MSPKMAPPPSSASAGEAAVATLLRVVGASLLRSAAFLRDNCWGAYSASSRTLHALHRPEVRLVLRRRWAAQSAVLLQLLAWTAHTVGRNVRGSMRSARARWGEAMHAALMDTALRLMGANAPLPSIEFDDHGFFDEFHAVLEPHRSTPRLRDRTAAATRTASVSGKPESSPEDEFELLPSAREDPAFYTEESSESEHKTAQPADLALKRTDAAGGAGPDPLASPVCLESYLCGCGECPQYEAIAQDVDAYATWLDAGDKRRATRLLQALTTYSEGLEYSREMVVAAEECLQVWQGDEDRAFRSMAVLFDEVPRLCAGSA